MKIKRLLSMVTLLGISMASVAQTQLQSGIDPANLDRTVRVADDFYGFACGGWMKQNPLPAIYSRYGSFDQLSENNEKRINGILNELLTGTFADGSEEKKLSDFYRLAMDSVRRDNDGVKPVMPIIDKMQKAKNKKQLFDIQLSLVPYGDSEFYTIYLGADRKNSKMNILNTYQGGTTLGQKEYYLDTDSATTAIREAYKKHVVRMFQLFGFSKAESEVKMTNLLKIETALAKVSRTRTELRDAERNYNKMTLKEFTKRYPNLKFAELCKAKGIKPENMQEVVVGQPEFLDGANKIVGNLTVAEYRDYMQWGQIMSAASYLSEEVAEANFDFFGRTMSGRKANYPLWQRATSVVNRQMGESLGKMYVKRYFPATSKERMETLVKNLQNSLSQRIDAQKWMSAETKKAAQEKLATFRVKIGYPEKWTDMSSLNIDPKKSFYDNIVECRRFWTADDVARNSGKPVDPDEWHMTPQTVNAYYNPTTNEICFPAGILQMPFFSPDVDDAFNYGAIGVVIGHEMTHGFDDQGRRYDKDGNMRDWWAAGDAEKFNKIADRCVAFFDKIEVLPGLNANGRFTLGENLADHGGIQVAFNAFKIAQAAKKDRGARELKEGFTPEQRFFLAYSGVWAGNITDAEIRNRTKSDPHSLGRWRVNGTLPHIDSWYDAFGVSPGDKLYIPKSERIDLW